MTAPEPTEVVRETLRRWAEGEPLADRFSADYRTQAELVVPFAVPPDTTDVERRRRATLEQDVDVRFARFESGPEHRVLVETVWAHRPDGGRGSAGRGWTVFTVEGERITASAYFNDESSAREAAGL